MRFQFIEKNRSSFPVKKMCHVLDVSVRIPVKAATVPVIPSSAERASRRVFFTPATVSVFWSSKDRFRLIDSPFSSNL